MCIILIIGFPQLVIWYEYKTRKLSMVKILLDEQNFTSDEALKMKSLRL